MCRLKKTKIITIKMPKSYKHEKSKYTPKSIIYNPKSKYNIRKPSQLLKIVYLKWIINSKRVFRR